MLTNYVLLFIIFFSCICAKEMSKRPDIMMFSKWKVCGEAEEALIRCSVQGSTDPRFSWSKETRYGYEDLKDDDKHYKPYTLPVQYRSPYHIHYLKIFNVTKRDAGTYRCKVTNDYGTSENKTALEVIDCFEQIVVTVKGSNETATRRLKATDLIIGYPERVVIKKAKVGEKVTVSCSVVEGWRGNDAKLAFEEHELFIAADTRHDICIVEHNGIKFRVEIVFNIQAP